MNTRIGLSRFRFYVQILAFGVILLNPFLNYYFHIDFIQGWYQSLGVGRLWFVSPLEGLESILVSKLIYLPLLIGMLIPVLVALFLGRVFCAWICPINFLSELIDSIASFFAKRFKMSLNQNRYILPRYILWFALIAELVLAMVLGAPLFVFLSPPGLVGREIMLAVFFKTMAIEGLIVVAVLAMNLVTKRFYCRYFCPLGALLAFLGAKRRLVVQKNEELCAMCKRCDKACPLGLVPSEGEAASIYCWNCGACVDKCGFRAIGFSWRAIGPIKKVSETCSQLRCVL